MALPLNGSVMSPRWFFVLIVIEDLNCFDFYRSLSHLVSEILCPPLPGVAQSGTSIRQAICIPSWEALDADALDASGFRLAATLSMPTLKRRRVVIRPAGRSGSVWKFWSAAAPRRSSGVLLSPLTGNIFLSMVTHCLPMASAAKLCAEVHQGF